MPYMFSKSSLIRAMTGQSGLYATEHGCAVISKDADFADLALLDSHRVQVIWVRVGNCRRSVLLEVFKSALETIEQKLDSGETLIELY
jgi:predicted nuclease of predicted toxin-antitoxin system